MESSLQTSWHLKIRFNDRSAKSRPVKGVAIQVRVAAIISIFYPRFRFRVFAEFAVEDSVEFVSVVLTPQFADEAAGGGTNERSFPFEMTEREQAAT